MSSVKVYAAVKGRIQADTRLLEAIKSEDIRSKTAEKHCKIIMDALRGSVGLRPFEAADLSELVSNAGFDEAIETAILTAIMECPDDGIGDAESESKRQNYRALCNYLPEGVWDACGADPDVLCDTAAMLGLRDPDEPTVAMMTSGCDCPNCRAGKAVNLVEYSRAPQRGSASYAPSSRTVSYRNAAPSTQKMR